MRPGRESRKCPPKRKFPFPYGEEEGVAGPSGAQSHRGVEERGHQGEKETDIEEWRKIVRKTLGLQ